MKGTYTFASIGQGRFEQVTLLPKEKIQKKEQQHVSDRDVAALLRSDETIHSSVRYEVLTDHIKLSYKGNTAARFWSDAARMILPLLFFGAIALFLMIRRNRISDCLRRAKDRLEHWLETKR